MADEKKTGPAEGVEGQSFRNEALTGAGTILPDGGYGEPLPDPTEVRGLGPNKTSGGREVLGGGLGDADAESTGETSQVSRKTRSQASTPRGTGGEQSKK